LKQSAAAWFAILLKSTVPMQPNPLPEPSKTHEVPSVQEPSRPPLPPSRPLAFYLYLDYIYAPLNGSIFSQVPSTPCSRIQIIISTRDRSRERSKDADG
jgi:hypothetical protein